jgi:hypothetical protein
VEVGCRDGSGVVLGHGIDQETDEHLREAVQDMYLKVATYEGL